MSIITRFAPSPTGNIHVGNLRIALANKLFCQKLDGKFILRHDDTDLVRSRSEFSESIRNDLLWSGLSWDEEIFQSSRLSLYKEAVIKLKESGRLYACYDTREELDLMRRRLLSAGKPPIYDRRGLHLGDAERIKLESIGRIPHWRFLLDGNPAKWGDLIRGDQEYNTNNISDPVLIREDGSYLYTLPSVVDDISCGVTHIIRGEDHVTNTAVQIQIFEALGNVKKQILFAHLPLLTDRGGDGLSKRLGSLSVKDLKESGLEPMAICSFLTYLGTSLPLIAHQELSSLVNDFEFSNYSRNPPKFNQKDLLALNRQLIREMPFNSVSDRLGIKEADEMFWVSIRENIDSISEASEWWNLCQGSGNPIITEQDYLTIAIKLLPKEPWNEDTYGEWVNSLKRETQRKGRDLFLPLRLAITGKEHGPGLKNLLPLIGRERTKLRLMGRSN